MTHTNTEALSDERLAEFLLDYAKRAGAIGIPGSIVPILTKAGEALSRRSASNTGGVEVKALQWRDNSGSRNATNKCADTPFGLYDYSKYGDRWAVYGQGTLIAEPDDEQGCVAAAQADFNQRILSAIVSSSVSAEVTVTDAQKPYGGFYRKCSADTPGAEWAEGVGYHVHDEQARIEGRMEAAAIAANFGRHPTLDPDADRTDAESLEQAASEADGRPEVGGE